MILYGVRNGTPYALKNTAYFKDFQLHNGYYEAYLMNYDVSPKQEYLHYWTFDEASGEFVESDRDAVPAT